MGGQAFGGRSFQKSMLEAVFILDVYLTLYDMLACSVGCAGSPDAVAGPR